MHGCQPFSVSETLCLPPVPSIVGGHRLGLLRVQDCFKFCRVWPPPRLRVNIFQIHFVCIVFRGQTMQMRKRICFRGVWRSSRAQQLTMPRHTPLCGLPLPGVEGDSAVERRDQHGHRIRDHDQNSVFTCSGPDIHYGQTSLTRIERVVSAVQSEEPRKFCCHFLAIVFSLAARLVGLWSAVALRVTTLMSLSVLTWGPKNKIRGG